MDEISTNRLLFAVRVKELRQRMGWTKTDLAGFVGVDKSLITGWENGSRVAAFENICKLSKTFNVDPAYLLGLADTYLPLRKSEDAKKTAN